MRFKRKIKSEELFKTIELTPLIDCVFLLLIFFMLTSSFILVPGINVKLPKAVTSQQISIQRVVIVVTSEDIIYFEDKPVTLKELFKILKEKKAESVFIKADKDASLGRIVEIWDICKKLGIDKIGIATTYKEEK
ncbi:MAG: hypothetical protein B6D55_08630 [Candidatus Omnitrophica bacterium 4484_70.2]|nr:MAG: hypothetical protein B6D55_08630 [Candidatus Omnitrophica bacterium 4484_70.2]